MNPGAGPYAEFLAALGARSPVPGGGAAACAAAAAGCAVAAMACRYTTGRKWTDRAEEAAALAERLDGDGQALLDLAEADAEAYRLLSAASKDPDLDPAELKRLETEAAGVPLEVLRRLAGAADALRAFRDRCNPRLVCDLDAGLHLIAGAARAAEGILKSNGPAPAVRDEAAALVDGATGRS